MGPATSHQQFWKCTISTGILAFFSFSCWNDMNCWVYFYTVKSEERLWSPWNISSFLKLANVISTYWVTSGALPGYARLPIALCPSKIPQPPGDSGHQVWGGGLPEGSCGWRGSQSGDQSFCLKTRDTKASSPEVWEGTSLSLNQRWWWWGKTNDHLLSTYCVPGTQCCACIPSLNPCNTQ